MVTTPSTSAQANEMEKRRKQTLEKAKANHLSRQLQMRLQYARLKVEYGWQKQNLNEVENLYFHHSHQRGTKPYLNSTSILTVSQYDQSTTPSPSKFADPSYRIWLNSLSRSSTLDTVVDAHANASQTSNTTENNNNSFLSTSFQNSSLSQPLAPPAEPYPSQATHTIDPLVRTPTQNYLLPTALQGGNTAPSTSLPTPTPTTPSHLNGLSGNGIATPASATKSKKLNSRVQPTHKSSIPLSSTDMFNFNSSSLTYDMFWSGLKTYPPRSATPVPGTLGSNSAPQTNVINSGHLSLPSDSTTTPSSASSSTSSTPPSASGPSHQGDTLINQPPTSTVSISTSFQPPPPPILTSIATDNQVDNAQNHTSRTVLNWNNSNFISTPTTSAAAPSSTSTPSTGSTSVTAASISGSIPIIGGVGGIPTNLIPASLLSNPAAFPFLASLSASYANAFGAGTGTGAGADTSTKIGESGNGGWVSNGIGNGQSGSSSSDSSRANASVELGEPLLR